MINTLLKQASQNLQKISKQMLPFLKLLVETHADILLVQNMDNQHGQNMGLINKLINRSEIFILEIRKMLLEFEKQKKLNFDIQKRIIESNFQEFELEHESSLVQLLRKQGWFIDIQNALDDIYNEKSISKIDKLIDEAETL
ncbi:unnamed protein product (macronuclear) [Paramecium tetraurelia]|uniref:Uncharacterized protein n=1 Tax=Paramecium tetraurelia TaxID=5888 RepID=A0EC57_PARTE|nr:uncharacterized protein GSPATT00025610001 [Paramecium tetraurelia]CAK92874.1 unnamed protein product [Paramecium tetraurelia]|eukprot:XP_001460271.1 hypothetical protein (macronuclear) [Paramecium tetraurelia strain d4-2]